MEFYKDALHRNDLVGHFREEYQTADGEAKRDDENFAYVAAWNTKETNDAVYIKRRYLVMFEKSN
jgi:succinate dehydrogenase / fumarate reductase flavoprotein subunit